MAKASFKIVGKVATPRNPIASALANGSFRARAVKAKKGRGSYNRKEARKEKSFSYGW